MAITAAAGGGNWSVGATWVGGIAPTAADDVLLTVASGNVTIDAANNVCRSIDCTTYTGTLTFGAAGVLSVGDASGGALKFVAGMTVTLSGGTLSFVSTSNNGGTGWNITTGGKILPSTTFNGVGGKWVCQDAFSADSNTVTVTNGAFFGNGQAITTGSFASNNSNTRTVDLTNCSVTMSSTATAWNFNSITGLTFVATGSTLTFTGSTANFSANSLTYGSIVFSACTGAQCNGSFTCTNFTITGTAVKTGTFTIASAFTVTTALTLNGNSATNRILVQSSTIGTARTITITAASVTASHLDLKDITLSVATDLSAITGGSGDCGGNSGITFTVAATQTHTASAGGNWSDVSKWTSRVPLPQDDVIVDANTTGTLAVEMPRIGKSINFSGFVGTLQFGFNNMEFYGNITFNSGLTQTGAFTLIPAGRGSHTITSGGKALICPIVLKNPGGTYTLTDAFSTSQTFEVQFGSFNTGGFSLTILSFMATTGAATITITLGSSTVSLTTTLTATIWDVVAATTLSAASSIIVVSSASANTRTFGGASKTYGTLTYTVATSTGQLTITGANSFLDLNFSDASNARTLSMPTATSTTIRGRFNVIGTTGKLMTVIGDVTSTALQRYGNFLSINNSDATGGPWYAGANSTDGGSNTGWIFAAAPPPDAPGRGSPQSSMWNNRRVRSRIDRDERPNNQTITQPIHLSPHGLLPLAA